MPAQAHATQVLVTLGMIADKMSHGVHLPDDFRAGAGTLTDYKETGGNASRVQVAGNLQGPRASSWALDLSWPIVEGQCDPAAGRRLP